MAYPSQKLWDAASSGDMGAVCQLVMGGADVNFANPEAEVSVLFQHYLFVLFPSLILIY